jgi:hypothetical protein
MKLPNQGIAFVAMGNGCFGPGTRSHRSVAWEIAWAKDYVALVEKGHAHEMIIPVEEVA